MQNYKTVEEKAIEWNMSSRHIQYLCRNGKIEGAQKHAGVWFIPSDTPSPAKHSRPGIGEFKYAGTKKRIFYSAIKLFELDGFDSVSMRDVADKVGIRQSTIYNHFKSKQEILDTIYDFFCYYHQKDRPSMEDMKAKLQNESLMEIVKAIRYEFKEDYIQAMSDIAKIIFQRIGIDSRAREIAKTLILDEGIRYVEAVFNMGIDNGRFAPFDTHTMAVFINSVRIFTLYIWILDLPPEDMMKFMEVEQRLYEYTARFIEDLSPFGKKK